VVTRSMRKGRLAAQRHQPAGIERAIQTPTRSAGYSSRMNGSFPFRTKIARRRKAVLVERMTSTLRRHAKSSAASPNQPQEGLTASGAFGMTSTPSPSPIRSELNNSRSGKGIIADNRRQESSPAMPSAAILIQRIDHASVAAQAIAKAEANSIHRLAGW